MEKKLPEGWRWGCKRARRVKERGKAMEGVITGVRKEILEEKIKKELGKDIQERRVKMRGEWWRIVTVYS